MSSRIHLGVAIVAIATLLANASQAGVVNGGFETGDFSGWTQSGNLGFTSVVPSPVHLGSFAASFGPIGSTGILSQTLSTTAGQSYNIGFWLRNNGGNPNFFSASFDGILLTSITDGLAQDYTEYNFTAIASTASTLLEFQFQQNPSFWQFDDVSVELSSVPEPGTLTLFGVGLVMAGAFRRRKAKA